MHGGVLDRFVLSACSRFIVESRWFSLMPAPTKPKKERRVELPPEGMEVLEISPLRLGASHLAELKADLANHQSRIEKIVSEMLPRSLDCIYEPETNSTLICIYIYIGVCVCHRLFLRFS